MVEDSNTVSLMCPPTDGNTKGDDCASHTVLLNYSAGQGRIERNPIGGQTTMTLTCPQGQEVSGSRGYLVSLTCPQSQGLDEISASRGGVVPSTPGQEGSDIRGHAATLTCPPGQRDTEQSLLEGWIVSEECPYEIPATQDTPHTEASDRPLPQHHQHHHHQQQQGCGPGSCAGCGQQISERFYLLAVDRQWHSHCLTCRDCHFRLDSQVTCYARDGHIYCKEDYYRRFAQKTCLGCQGHISANQLVMRARDQLFHLSCFSCSSCRRQLVPGEQFALRDQRLFCKTHFQLVLHHHQTRMPSHAADANGHAELGPNQNGSGSGWRSKSSSGTSKYAPARKRKDLILSEDGCSSLDMAPSEHSRGEQDTEGVGSQQGTGRQKRVRTSFKQHQLRTMRTYFSINHNPDAKDLRQLALRTGLTKRVLQVWFQNARAKYRRSLAKQHVPEDASQVSRTTPLTALPLPQGGEESRNGHRESATLLTDSFHISRSPAALSDISSTASGCGESVLDSVDCMGQQLVSADLWLL